MSNMTVQMAVEFALAVSKKMASYWEVFEACDGTRFIITPKKDMYPEYTSYMFMDDDIVHELDLYYILRKEDGHYFAAYAIAHRLLNRGPWELEVGELPEDKLRILWNFIP